MVPVCTVRALLNIQATKASTGDAALNLGDSAGEKTIQAIAVQGDGAQALFNSNALGMPSTDGTLYFSYADAEVFASLLVETRGWIDERV